MAYSQEKIVVIRNCHRGSPDIEITVKGQNHIISIDAEKYLTESNTLL